MAVEAFVDLLFAAAMAAAVLGLGYFAWRHSVGTVALVIVVWILVAGLRDATDIAVELSGIRIAALDALSVVLLTVGVARALTYGVRSVGRGLALALLLLLTIHLARGLAEFGTEAGLGGARGWLYFTAGLVYTATVPGGLGTRVWKVFVIAGAALAAIAVPYFLLEGVGTATEQISRNGELVTSRPVVAAGGLLILQAAVIALALRWPSRNMAVAFAVWAGAVVILLQHRTVWVAGLVTVVVGGLWWASRQDKRAKPVVFAATGITLLLLPVAVWAFLSTTQLVESASEVAGGSNSTLVWRTTGWGELISSHDSTLQLTSGNPAGLDWSRIINGDLVDTSAHNTLVDAYISFGLPGVLILLWLGLLLWFRRGDVAQGASLTAHAVGLLLLTQLVFGMAYPLDPVQGLLTGVLISGLVAARVAAAPATRPSTGVQALRVQHG